VEMRHSGALAQLRFETARRHGVFEAVAPPLDWMSARERSRRRAYTPRSTAMRCSSAARVNAA